MTHTVLMHRMSTLEQFATKLSTDQQLPAQFYQEGRDVSDIFTFKDLSLMRENVSSSGMLRYIVHREGTPKHLDKAIWVYAADRATEGAIKAAIVGGLNDLNTAQPTIMAVQKTATQS